MSDLKAAAQQALRALEYHVEQTRSIWKTSQAIDALRAALALPDEPKGGGNLPPPLQAEPVQEPVAWQWLNTGHFRKKLPVTAEPGVWTPLYTAPPRREWQSLTDTDIARVFRAVYGGARFGPSEKEFARAVEAALKEKNA